MDEEQEEETIIDSNDGNSGMLVVTTPGKRMCDGVGEAGEGVPQYKRQMLTHFYQPQPPSSTPFFAPTFFPSASVKSSSSNNVQLSLPSLPSFQSSFASLDLAAAASQLSMGASYEEDGEAGQIEKYPLSIINSLFSCSSSGGTTATAGRAVALRTSAAMPSSTIAVRVKSVFVPGQGTGKLHIVAPPSTGTGNDGSLQDISKVAFSFLRLNVDEWKDLLPEGVNRELHRPTKDIIVRIETIMDSNSRSSIKTRMMRRCSSSPAVVAAAATTGHISGGAAVPSTFNLSGLGGAIFLSLLHLFIGSKRQMQREEGKEGLSLIPFSKVAVIGDITLEGRFFSIAPPSTASNSSVLKSISCPHTIHLLAPLRALLAAGAECVILPKQEEEREGGPWMWQQLTLLLRQEQDQQQQSQRKRPPFSLHFASNVSELLSILSLTGSGMQSALPLNKNKTRSNDRKLLLYSVPTILPLDCISVALRHVEVGVLPHRDTCSGTNRAGGEFIITGLIRQQSPSGDNDESSREQRAVRAAINTVRFLVLKHQGEITAMLGPPVIDLRTMKMKVFSSKRQRKKEEEEEEQKGRDGDDEGFMDEEEEEPQDDDDEASTSAADIHLHFPEALPSGAYALPILLALVAVAWGGESLDRIASLGDIDGLGRLSLHDHIRPTFIAALRDSGVTKILLPRAQALEIVRQEGGIGDRWVLRNGVLVHGIEGLLDAIRCCFLGDDNL